MNNPGEVVAGERGEGGSVHPSIGQVGHHTVQLPATRRHCKQEHPCIQWPWRQRSATLETSCLHFKRIFRTFNPPPQPNPLWTMFRWEKDPNIHTVPAVILPETRGHRQIVLLGQNCDREKCEKDFYLVHFILSSRQRGLLLLIQNTEMSLAGTSIRACTQSARDYCVIPSALNYPEWERHGRRDLARSCALVRPPPQFVMMKRRSWSNCSMELLLYFYSTSKDNGRIIWG